MKKKPRYGPEIKAQAQKLSAEGLGYTAVGKQLGVPYSTVRLWLHPTAAMENRERAGCWAKENHERRTEYVREWRKQNQGHKTEYDAAYYEANREKVLSNVSAYRKNNPEKKREAESRRRAAKLLATPPWFGKEYKQVCLSLQSEALQLEQETGVQHHVDHIYPLIGKTRVDGKYQHTSCGLHVPWNLRVIPGPENIRKNCKLPDPKIHPPTAW